ncbi:SDR family oxidoreductase [Rhodococcus wratislaviensis]|uniref:SDR family oxidoreductase n=1 Tax=Rhodococcus wratislaviensis TaxID=44752 RepID=UPI003666D1DD
MKIAVVTGAARGIGFEIARRLTKDGYRLVLVDVDPTVGDSAASIDATPVKADIADPEGRARIRSAIRSEEGQPTLLVNNAGITRDALIGDMTEPNFRLVNRINLGATFELTSELADEIVDGGAVVNISSRAYLGNVGQFNYAISKGGVVGLTRSLALSHAPRLRVNAVAPGFIATDMTDAVPARVRDRIISRIPLQRPGRPIDIAEAVAWLGSDQAAYVTGQVLPCCGGRSHG